MALIGLMQTLAPEGKRCGMHVNSVAPSTVTQMTGALLPPEDPDGMGPSGSAPRPSHS